MSHFVCDNLVLSCCQKIKGMLVCLHQLSTHFATHTMKAAVGSAKMYKKEARKPAGTVCLPYCERAVSVIQ